MFAHLLSLTSRISHRFEPPPADLPTPLPDVTPWLVPVSAGLPRVAAASPDPERALEAADEEITERDPIAVGWRRAALAEA